MASPAPQESEDELKLELFEACQHGTWRDVTRLLQRGASLEWVHATEKLEPFHYALLGDNYHVAENILNERRNTLVPTAFMIIDKLPNGECPIHMACRLGHVALVDLIIRWSGLMNILENKDGELPIHVTCLHGHNSVLNRLVNTSDFKVDILNNRKETPLHKACLNGHTEVVRTLLRKHANVNIEHPTGESPLHTAIARAYWDIVDLLLQRPDLAVDVKDITGTTPLHSICRVRREYIAPPPSQSANTAQALRAEEERAALDQASLTAMKTLLEAGAQTDTVAIDRSTPLYDASCNGDAQAGQQLLDHGAQVRVPEAHDPLQKARDLGHEHVVKILGPTGLFGRLQLSEKIGVLCAVRPQRVFEFWSL